MDSIWNVSSVQRGMSEVPHYYGTTTRQLLLGAAALMLVASPFYTTDLRTEFLYIVIGVVVIVACAALLNPHSKWVSVVTALVSGVGVGAYAMWGLFEYDAISPVAFVLRLAIAVILLFSFYFSLKTVRAFMLHQIGKRGSVDEFESDEDKARTDKFESEAMRERPDNRR